MTLSFEIIIEEKDFKAIQKELNEMLGNELSTINKMYELFNLKNLTKDPELDFREKVIIKQTNK